MCRRRARNPEGGFDGWMPSIGKPAVQRDVKNELKVEIHRIEGRCVAESVEGCAGSRLRSVDKTHHFADNGFVQNSMRLPQHERQVLAERYVSGKSHVVCMNPWPWF